MTSIALLKAAFMERSYAKLKRASNLSRRPGASAAAVNAGCGVVSDDNLSVAFDQFLKCRSTGRLLFIRHQPRIGYACTSASASLGVFDQWACDAVPESNKLFKRVVISSTTELD